MIMSQKKKNTCTKSKQKMQPVKTSISRRSHKLHRAFCSLPLCKNPAYLTDLSWHMKRYHPVPMRAERKKRTPADFSKFIRNWDQLSEGAKKAIHSQDSWATQYLQKTEARQIRKAQKAQKARRKEESYNRLLKIGMQTLKYQRTFVRAKNRHKVKVTVRYDGSTYVQMPSDSESETLRRDKIIAATIPQVSSESEQNDL